MQVLPAKPMIAIVEDDPDLRSNLIDIFTLQDYSVWGVDSAEKFFRELAVTQPDIVLLDLGLPGEDGLSVLQHLQQTQRYLFIVISARNFIADKELSLQAGAKAYFPKPLNIQTLLKKITDLWAIRCAECDLAQQEWALDTSKQRIHAPNGCSMNLTTNEYLLLATLMVEPGRLFNKEEIMMAIWVKLHSLRSYHAVEVLLSRLRAKSLVQLKIALPIQSVQAVGLVFSAAVKGFPISETGTSGLTKS